MHVATYEGESANGPIHGPEVAVPGVYVKDQQELIRDSSGAEILSRATVRFNLEDLPPVGSKVTVWKGSAQEYAATVAKVARHSHPGWASIGTGWLL